MVRIVIYSLIFFIIACVGCINGENDAVRSYLVAANKSTNPQAETFAVLEKYLKTSDTSMREFVENATGRKEILATKIYNAYWIYLQRYQGMDVKEEARQVLYTNPSLTLMLLRPLLFEKFPEEPEPSKMSVKGDGYWRNIRLQKKGQDCFFGICAEIAQIEDDGYARSILQDLADGNYGEYSQWAYAEVEDIDSNRQHYKLRAEDYRKTKNPKIIDWFSENYFWAYSKQDNLTEHDILSLLGPADYKIGAKLVYKGHGGEPYNYLWLHFFDQHFIEAHWGQKPGVNKDDEKGKSSFWQDL